MKKRFIKKFCFILTMMMLLFTLASCGAKKYESYEFEDNGKEDIGFDPLDDLGDGEPIDEELGEGELDGEETSIDPATPTELSALSEDYYKYVFTPVTASEQGGTPVFDLLLPLGWDGGVSIDQPKDAVYPYVGQIVISSPNGDAKIFIETARHYLQSYIETGVNGGVLPGQMFSESSQDWQTDETTYTTYLDYRQAPTYAEFYVETYLGGTATSSYFDEQATDELQVISDKYYSDSVTQFSQELLPYMGVTQFREDWHEATVGGARYTSSNGVGEVTAIVMGQQATYTIPAATQYVTDTNMVYTTWLIPMVAGFQASNDEAFNEWYDTYKTVVHNITLRPEFTQTVSQRSQQIEEMVMKTLGEIARHRTITDTESGVTVDTMEMWDDVIKEQNDYMTEEGTRIKVPTVYDTVYENDGSIYMGPEAYAPEGWTKLETTY